MPAIYGNCDTDIVAPGCDPCLSQVELGGVRSIAYVHESAISDIMANPSSTANWDYLRSLNQIFIIPETKGVYNGGEAIEQPGFGDKTTRVTGFTHEIEYDDPSYLSNCAFYNLMMQSSRWYVAFRTESSIRISNKPVSVIPSAPVQEDNSTEVYWHVIARWIEKGQPCPVDAPADTFICLNTDMIASAGPTLNTTQAPNDAHDPSLPNVDITISSQSITGQGGTLGLLVAGPYFPDAPANPDYKMIFSAEYVGFVGSVGFQDQVAQCFDVTGVPVPCDSPDSVGQIGYFINNSSYLIKGYHKEIGKLPTISDSPESLDIAYVAPTTP